jgi:catalase
MSTSDQANDQVKPTTTDAGIPVTSDEHSLTVGPDGPILLQDHYLIEQMAAFNRERIPERQPHAKGSGAFGNFEVTNDVSAYTKAALFQPGTTTDTLMRFSTVAGSGAAPTPGVTPGASRSSSTHPRATTTWWATTPPCSSSVTR